MLLSTIGSRGDVQPLVALALRLREAGQEVRLCVPPDFQDWIEGLGFSVTPVGPTLRSFTAARPSPEALRRLAEASVATQFETIAEAAQKCDLIVAATALQIGARSVAEKLGIPYVFVAYCPMVLDTAPGEGFNSTFGAALNANRAALGLTPVDDVRSHIFTTRPWLAADPTLGPWPDSTDPTVFQPGAWIVPDDRPLAPELEKFLDDGEPPVYFGFGSIRAPESLSESMIGAARALGRRAIVSRGWAELSLVDTGPDCLSVGEVNQQALFTRVAAVVHHGGAGTTTAAALAGAPQVVVPQIYDQHYWAARVQELGIGTAHAPGAPTAVSLTAALEQTLRPEVAAGAASAATWIHREGAWTAVERLLAVR